MTVMNESPAQDEAAHDSRKLGELVKDAADQVSVLVREEIKLAKLELADKGKRVGRGAAFFGVAGILGVYGIGVLVAAGVLGLAVVVDPWLAALIAGVGVLVLAGIFALVGAKQIGGATPPVPSEAIQGLKTDLDVLKGRAS